MPGQGLQTVDGWTAGWRLEVIAVASPPGKSIYMQNLGIGNFNQLNMGLWLRMLFEGTLVLVVGGACLRVWSMAAKDLQRYRFRNGLFGWSFSKKSGKTLKSPDLSRCIIIFPVSWIQLEEDQRFPDIDAVSQKHKFPALDSSWQLLATCPHGRPAALLLL